MTRPRTASLAGALLFWIVAAFSPPQAAALRPAAHFFPLAWHDRDASGCVETDLVWPLWLSKCDPHSEGSLKALRPLFSAGRDTTGREAFFDMIYPLIGWRRWDGPSGSGERFLRIWALPLFFGKITETPGGDSSRNVIFPLFYYGNRNPPGARYFVFFPFWWDIDKGASFHFPLYNEQADRSRALWPIYGEFRNLFGAEHLWFAAWPLWVQSHTGEDKTQTLLWPFFSRTSGPGVNAWRAWPLVSYKERRDTGYRLSYLWPLGYHIRRQKTNDGPDLKLDMFLPLYIQSKSGEKSLKYYFPFYGKAQSPKRKTTSWFWPIYMRTVSSEPEFTQTRILYFIYNRKKGEEEQTQSLFPLAGETEQPRRSRRYALFPFFFERRDQKMTGRKFDRFYMFPFVIHERWRNADDTLFKQRDACLPFYRRIEQGDGRTEFSFPHLWWYTERDGIKRNWAPLWTLYSSYDDGAGTFERRVLWRLYRSCRIEGVGTEREINYILGRWRSVPGEGQTFSFLGLEW